MARDLTGITTNANVNFIRATQAQINSAINNNKNDWVQGTFYLTKDTDRLYFAQSATELVALNQFVHMWEGSELPTTSTYANLAANDIFYWGSKNALIICDDPSTPSFTQLNPDTYLKATDAALSVSGSGNARQVSLTIEDTTNGSNTKHRAQGNFTITGGTNVTVTNSGNNITIASTDTNDNTTYDLSLTNDTANNGVNVVLTGTPHVNGVAGTAITDSVKIVGENLTVSSTGDTITLSANSGVSSVSNAFDGNGKLTTTIGLSAGGSITSTNDNLVPTITYGASGAQENAHFESGTAELDVYTTTQVDQLIDKALAEADALTYKGTVSSTDASTKLDLSTAKIGDTYKATTEITNNNLSGGAEANTAKPGDLIIATGTNVNGVETVTGWDVVPSGDDQSINVDLNTSKTFIVKDNNTPLGGLKVDGSTNTYGTINVTESTSGSTKVLTVAHGAAGAAATQLGSGAGETAYTAVAAGTTLDYGTAIRGTGSQGSGAATSIDIPTITGIKYDAAGHITNISTATYRVVDSHTQFNNFTNTVVDGTNAATVTHVLTVDGTALPTALQPKFTIAAADSTGSLQVSGDATNHTISLGLVWGEFPV